MKSANSGALMSDPTDPPVTDHAIIRYLERYLGFPIEKTRAHIAAQCRDAIRAGAVSKTLDHVRFEFAGGKVITVTEINNGHPSKTRQNKLAVKP